MCPKYGPCHQDREGIDANRLRHSMMPSRTSPGASVIVANSSGMGHHAFLLEDTPESSAHYVDRWPITGDAAPGARYTAALPMSESRRCHVAPPRAQRPSP